MAKYGSTCSEECHCANGVECDPSIGCPDGPCADEYSGKNCQVPDTCPVGKYGELCKYYCHCEDDGPCNRATGSCGERKCKHLWIGNDCQLDPPVMTTAPLVTVSDTIVTVTWDQWTNIVGNGDGPVIGYKVCYTRTESSFKKCVENALNLSASFVIDSDDEFKRGLDYIFVVSAIRPGIQGEGAFSPSSTSVTIPCLPPEVAPSIVEVSSLGISDIQVQWQLIDAQHWRCNSLDSYQVEYKMSESRSFLSQTVTSTATAAIISNLDPCTSYQIKVISTNSRGLGPSSDIITVATDVQEPGDITLRNSVISSPDSLTLTWNIPSNPECITSFNVDYKLINLDQCNESVTTETESLRFSATATEGVLSNLLSHSLYRLSLYAALGNETTNPVVTEANTSGSRPSGPPIAVLIQNLQHTELSFKWQPPECGKRNGPITKYTSILRNSTYTNIKEVSKMSVTFSSLLPCTEYTFQVKALNGDLVGPLSNVLPVQTAPQEPENVTITGAIRSLLVRWKFPASQGCDIDFYKLEYQVENPGMCGENLESVGRSLNTTSTSIEIRNLEVFSQYSVTIRAVIGQVGRTNNVEGPGTSLNGRTGEEEPLVGPEDIQAIISQEATNDTPGEIEISFGSVPCLQKRGVIIHYKVRVIDGDGNVFGNTMTVVVSPAIITGGFPCESVTPQVAACTSAGCGGFKNGSSITMNPAAPGKASVDVKGLSSESNKLFISWLAPEVVHCPIVEYKIEYRLTNLDQCQDQINAFEVNVVNHTETQDVLLNLVPFSTYEVIVSAGVDGMNGNIIFTRGQTDFGNTTSTDPTAPPENIINHKIENARSLNFTWEEIPCGHRRGQIVKYNYTLKVGSSIVRQDAVMDKTVIIRNLIPCTSYLFMVSGRRPEGQGPDSDSIEARTNVEEPDRVQNVTVTGANRSILVRWEGPDTEGCEINFYKLEYQLENPGMCGENLESVGRSLNTTSTSIEIRNLEVFSQYSVTIHAVISQVGRTNNVEGPGTSLNGRTGEEEPLVGPEDIQAIISQEATNDTPGEIEISFGLVPCLQKRGVIIHYKVRVIDGDGNVLGNIMTVHVSPATITGGYPCESVTPQVAACTSAGCGVYENGSNITMNPAEPDSVQNVTITGASRSLLVKWEAPATQGCEIDFYKLEYQMENPGMCGKIVLSVEKSLNTTTTNIEIRNLEVFSHYSVTIRAVIGHVGGTNNFEGQETRLYSRTDEAEPLVGPEDIQAIISQEATNDTPGEIEISFGSVPCLQKRGVIIQYKVRVIDGDGNVFGNTMTVGVSPAIITGGYPCESITPQVAACTSAGCGGFENGSSITMNPAEPDSVQNVTITGASRSLLVKWEAPVTQGCEIEFYKLEFQMENLGMCGENVGNVRSLNTTSTSIEIRNLEVFSQYSVTIRAVIGQMRGTNKVEGPGTSLHGRTDEAEPLVGPKDIKAIVSQEATNDTPGEIEISFGSVPCLQKRGVIIHYKVRVIDGDGNVLGNTITVGVSPAIITGGFPCESVTPQVAACTSAGCGGFKNGSNITMNPEAPGKVSVDVKGLSSDSKRLFISWSAPEVVHCPILEYKIEYKLTYLDRCQNQSNEFQVKVVNYTETQDTLLNLTPFSSYDVVVSAGVKGMDGNTIFTRGRTGFNYTATTDATAPPDNIINHKTENARSLNFTWEEIPCGHRRGSIVKYNYTLKMGSSIVRQDAVMDRTVMIRNLIPCTSYIFMVSGRGPEGQGPDSDSMEARTNVEVPESVEHIVDQETTLVWDRPPPMTCDILRYHIHASLIERDQCQQVDISTNFTVEDAEVKLKIWKPYSTYLVNISAETDAGLGPETTHKFVTPEKVPAHGPKEVNVTAVSATGASFAWSEIECGYRRGLIRGYQFSLQNADGQELISNETRERQCEFDDLTPFTKYIFSVKGFNSKGDGKNKELHITTDESIPSVIDNVKILSTDFKSFRIKWSRPEPSNGIVIGYQINYTVIDGLENNPQSIQYDVSAEERNTTDLIYTIGNLQPNTNYSVQAAAFTSVGVGPWSDLLYVFTLTSSNIASSISVNLIIVCCVVILVIFLAFSFCSWFVVFILEILPFINKTKHEQSTMINMVNYDDFGGEDGGVDTLTPPKVESQCDDRAPPKLESQCDDTAPPKLDSSLEESRT
ncbi:phosphatidylinositol phosphatase PTPRQ-like [Anneissia japonica]|uniref:phosphatidylinositol phosphatase PTPRQ-like n=1 Tax=Anneissia japonica TaxID=1529436 RepID=UPI0014257394|nr:phosphatidylinositol phosphatase PTPRQ-like [Anneissia japonica]